MLRYNSQTGFFQPTYTSPQLTTTNEQHSSQSSVVQKRVIAPKTALSTRNKITALKSNKSLNKR